MPRCTAFAFLALVTALGSPLKPAKASLIALDMDPNLRNTGVLWQTPVGWVFTTNAAVTVTRLGFWDSGANGFVTPLPGSGGKGLFGPNFQFVGEPVPVPEPSTLVLAGVGSLGLLTWVRCRRCQV